MRGLFTQSLASPRLVWIREIFFMKKDMAHALNQELSISKRERFQENFPLEEKKILKKSTILANRLPNFLQGPILELQNWGYQFARRRVVFLLAGLAQINLSICQPINLKIRIGILCSSTVIVRFYYNQNASFKY